MSRPLSKQWKDGNAASADLGISARQLRKLREQMKPGYHYRVKNPRSARPSYLWNVERIQTLLVPESIPVKN